MLNRIAVLTGMKLILIIMMSLGMQVKAAADERGFVKQPHSLRSLTHVSAVPQKSSALNPSEYLKHWLLDNRAAGPDGTAKTTVKTATRTIAGVKYNQPQINSNTAGPGKQARLQKMISALEEFNRAFNSTWRSRFTIMSQMYVDYIMNPKLHMMYPSPISGRNSRKKNKVLTAAEGGVSPTTSCPVLLDSTASRASADVIPSLTGQNFRKSFPPQAKKTNKRVCFWKYCSQN